MKVAPRIVILQPLSMLPVIYVASFIFEREITAVLVVFTYHAFIQWQAPFLILPFRISAKFEILGDSLYSLAKIILPFESGGSTFIYNESVLEQISRYRK